MAGSPEVGTFSLEALAMDIGLPPGAREALYDAAELHLLCSASDRDTRSEVGRRIDSRTSEPR